MKKCKTLSVALFVVFLFPFFITAASQKTNSQGNNSDKKACEYARNENSIEVWQDYLESFPKGECILEAKNEIRKLRKEIEKQENIREVEKLREVAEKAFFNAKAGQNCDRENYLAVEELLRQARGEMENKHYDNAKDLFKFIEKQSSGIIQYYKEHQDECVAANKLKNEFKNAPHWVLNGSASQGKLCSVGSAMTRTEATGMGRKEIVYKINQGVFYDYASKDSKEIIDNTVITAEQSWMSDSGILYVLVCTNIEDFRNSVNVVGYIDEARKKILFKRAENVFK